MQRTTIALILLACLHSSVAAQFGTVSGSVVDEKGRALRYANVIVVGTSRGALTDSLGRYTVAYIPAGRHTIKALMMYYSPDERENVVVRPGHDVRLDFALQPSPVPKAPTFPRRRSPDWMTIDSVTSVTNDQLQELYSATSRPTELKPARKDGLEFSASYTTARSNDSTAVRVVARCANVSGVVQSVCGVFSFVAGNNGVPRADRDYAEFGRTHDTARLRCQGRLLRPNQAMTDTLTFSYETAAVTVPPEEIQLWCVFFSGDNGEPWENTRFVDLGVLVIPFQ